MTPQEAAAFLKANVRLPLGATISVQSDKVTIGNADVNFVIKGDLLLTEESSMVAVQKSLPHLLKAMEDVAAQKAAAIKTQAEIKAKHAAAKKRKNPLK